MPVSSERLEQELRDVILIREKAELLAIWSESDATNAIIGFRQWENDIRIQLWLIRKGIVDRPHNIEAYATTRCSTCKYFFIFEEMFKRNNKCQALD